MTPFYRPVVERAVPAHMMILMMHEVRRAGFEFRADVGEQLEAAVASPMIDLTKAQVKTACRMVDAHARTLLDVINPDDPVEGLYSCAAFMLKLAEEGLQDRTNQAVLVAALILDDLSNDNDVDGAEVPYGLRLASWRKRADNALVRANLMGLYLRLCN
ncbi:MAG: hypothetical protein LC676_18315 [Loktanella sp.]|nr:hypothetical protein [Loktanella sp.]